MGMLRSAAGRVLGLFVSDWHQTVGIIAILVAAYVTRSLGVAGPVVGYGMAVALAAEVAISTLVEQRRRS